MSNSSNKHISNLDGLRAFAIILVVLFHTNNHLSATTNRFDPFFKIGWIGVYLFFVLSGFLVGSLAFREVIKTGKLNTTQFWGRRFLRTWPLYFVLLAFNFWRSPAIEPSLFHYLTFSQNFYSMNFFISTWSLAIEEQYYFLAPLVLLLLIGIRKIYLTPYLILSGIAAVLLFRAHYGVSTHTLAVVDSIFIGSLIGYFETKGNSFISLLKEHSNKLFILGLFIVFLGLRFQPNATFLDSILFGCISLGFGIILISTLNKRLFLTPLLSSKIMKFIALYSYSIYLTHDRPIFWVDKMIDKLVIPAWFNIAATILLGFLAAVATAAFFYYTIEKPALALREKLFSTR